MKNISDTIDKLSAAFSKEIRDCVTAGELAEIIFANKERADFGCHTHDFMDANMQMSDAWVLVYGTEFLPEDGTELGSLAVDLWNEAWGKSRESDFLNGISMGDHISLYEKWIKSCDLPHLSACEMRHEDLGDRDRAFLESWEARFDLLNA